jgi:hypothetical protein
VLLANLASMHSVCLGLHWYLPAILGKYVNPFSGGSKYTQQHNQQECMAGNNAQQKLSVYTLP